MNPGRRRRRPGTSPSGRPGGTSTRPVTPASASPCAIADGTPSGADSTHRRLVVDEPVDQQLQQLPRPGGERARRGGSRGGPATGSGARPPRCAARIRVAQYRPSRGAHDADRAPVVALRPPLAERLRRAAAGGRGSSSSPTAAAAASRSGPSSARAPARPAPPSPPRANRAGEDITHDAAAIATASADGTRCAARASSTFWARSRTRIDGMSMRTGHTSKHAPHSDEAYGSVGLSLIPVSCGDEHRADRPRVHRAVRVPAGALVDRADVHARRALDAVQRVAPDLVAQRRRAPVVQQHEVEPSAARRRG